MNRRTETIDRTLAALREVGLAAGPALRRRRRAMRTLGLSVVFLVPWTVYLAVALPDQFQARHWRVVWVGFDVMLLLSLLAAAVAMWLGRHIAVPCALVAATLLVCDAWFDVTLAWGTADVWESAASALLVELPLAGLLVWRARQALRLSVRLAWQRLGLPGEPPPLHALTLVTLAAGAGGARRLAEAPPAASQDAAG